ncbi:threonine aldolase family protein [Bdellovibrio sp. HCB337]|uniref:threonine aldolase family protein n=1 Tax=Bdellovibrio sp. HCB337 TaxID=3394358 RepID=UPI0039A6455F
MKRGFGSDNHSGVHPRILEAIAKANVQHAPSYGTDEWTEKAENVFSEHFGPKAEVLFVFNGTAANVLALKSSAKSFQSCYCTDLAHINVDECGAPEYLAGVKLIPLPSVNGKMRLEDLKKAHIRRGDQHFSQGQVISLTQPTELGTTYSMEELKEIITWAKSENLYVHIDGARLSNAAISLNKTFKELTTDLGVDIVSFGGTKNGLMMGEAVIFLNPALYKDTKYYRKQLGQLPSKTRFIAAQFLEYFNQDLWKEIATHACNMAEKLHESVRALPGVEVTQSRQSNAVFAKIPQAWVKPLRENYFFYVWDEHTFECRWMTSWDTDISDIDGFAKSLKELSR